MKRNQGQFNFRNNGSFGFVLTELFVIIVIIAFLAAILLPTLRGAKFHAQDVQCLNNQRQLNIAWHLYARDSNDNLAGNDWVDEAHWSQLPAGQQGFNWVSGWESAGDPTADPFSSGDETNTQLLTNPAYAQLAPYSRNPAIYQCVATRLLCQEPNGVIAPLCRDVSMNVWMGGSTITAQFTNANAVPGQDAADGYTVFTKLSGIYGNNSWRTFGPSQAFVFTEEKGDSIDDGEFLVQMTGWAGPEMANVPAAYHAGAGVVSFADGHAEVHKWFSQVCLTDPANMPPGTKIDAGIAHWSLSRPDNFRPFNWNNNTDVADLGWLQAHASITPNSSVDQRYTCIQFAKPSN